MERARPEYGRDGGFGLIETLLALLVLAVLVWQGAKFLGPQTGDQGELIEFRAALKQDLDPKHRPTLHHLTLQSLHGETEAGPFSYQVEGVHPRRQLIRTSSQGTRALLENVVDVRFLGFTSSGKFLPDEVSGPQLRRLGEIQIEASWHPSEEDSTFYLSDRVRGIDLDGDPSNGTARVKSGSFRLAAFRSDH